MEKPGTRTFHQRYKSTCLSSTVFMTESVPSAPPPPKMMPRSHRRGTLGRGTALPFTGERVSGRETRQPPPSHPILDAPRNKARNGQHPMEGWLVLINTPIKPPNLGRTKAGWVERGLTANVVPTSVVTCFLPRASSSFRLGYNDFRFLLGHFGDFLQEKLF